VDNHLEVGMRKKNESGFTLLEIALVILVAGLLIGAVLNSRGIQEAASSLRLQKQVEELKVAVDLYFDRMGVLPGSGDSPASNEWDQDLVDEQLVNSVRRANTHAFGSQVSFLIDSDGNDQPFGDTSTNSTVFRYDAIPAKWARTLIESLDDDVSNTGNIQVTDASSGSPLNARDPTDFDKDIDDGDDVFVFVKF
jgi:type II secretory pathway pseudopilin PulG